MQMKMSKQKILYESCLLKSQGYIWGLLLDFYAVPLKHVSLSL